MLYESFFDLSICSKRILFVKTLIFMKSETKAPSSMYCPSPSDCLELTKKLCYVLTGDNASPTNKDYSKNIEGIERFWMKVVKE